MARAGNEPSADLFPPPGRHRGRCARAGRGGSVCEWKGPARYFDVALGGRSAERAAWTYPKPFSPFAAIADHVAFYAAPMDACYVGEERASPQPGGFYGGWVTSRICGPFKGALGTMGW